MRFVIAIVAALFFSIGAGLFGSAWHEAKMNRDPGGETFGAVLCWGIAAVLILGLMDVL